MDGREYLEDLRITVGSMRCEGLMCFKAASRSLLTRGCPVATEAMIFCTISLRGSVFPWK